MGPAESKSYQLRVRVTAEERDQLEKLRLARGRGETISDLVREGMALLADPSSAKVMSNSKTHDQVERLAVLLKREPGQVQDACVEGILDLIESKCEVPLIVMETRLHLQYRGRNENHEFPWNVPGEALVPETPSVSPAEA